MCVILEKVRRRRCDRGDARAFRLLNFAAHLTGFCYYKYINAWICVNIRVCVCLYAFQRAWQVKRRGVDEKPAIIKWQIAGGTLIRCTTFGTDGNGGIYFIKSRYARTVILDGFLGVYLD